MVMRLLRSILRLRALGYLQTPALHEIRCTQRIHLVELTPRCMIDRRYAFSSLASAQKHVIMEPPAANVSDFQLLRTAVQVS